MGRRSGALVERATSICSRIPLMAQVFIRIP